MLKTTKRNYGCSTCSNSRLKDGHKKKNLVEFHQSLNFYVEFKNSGWGWQGREIKRLQEGEYSEFRGFSDGFRVILIPPAIWWTPQDGRKQSLSNGCYFNCTSSFARDSVRGIPIAKFLHRLTFICFKSSILTGGIRSIPRSKTTTVYDQRAICVF